MGKMEKIGKFERGVVRQKLSWTKKRPFDGTDERTAI